jgi:hypothetical protein
MRMWMYRNKSDNPKICACVLQNPVVCSGERGIDVRNVSAR